MSAEERYHRDPMFHALVESLYAAIDNLQLTPTEIREAAMLAQLKYEQRRRTTLPIQYPEIAMIPKEEI